jgi:hypothetical protein
VIEKTGFDSGGGHACECEFEYRPDPKPTTPAINYDIDDLVTWKRSHKPTSVDWDTAVVDAINYVDGIAEVCVLDGSNPYTETMKTEHVWVGALYKVEE